jgi:hypothetical protein
MLDLASMVAMALLAAAGLCLAGGLLLALDGLFRRHTSMAFEAIIFTAATVAGLRDIF